MGYNTKELLRDAKGNPIPQMYDPESDSFVPATTTQKVTDTNVLSELKKLNENNGIALQAYDKSVDALGKSEAAETNSVAAVETANEAKTIAETVKDEFDQVVAEAGENNPEVVQARGGEVNLGTRLNKMSDQLKESERQAQTLKHGLNVINSDQASPLGVEVYGRTIVNLLGKSGGFSYTNTTSGQWITVSNINLKSGNHYVINSIDWLNVHKLQVLTSNMAIVTEMTLPSAKKFIVPSDGDYIVRIQTTSNTTVNSGKVAIYSVDQSTYDKIGVSLTDSDIERMYPYVDSVQHVRNPMVKVESENLIPPFTEWNLHANATVKSPYELELNATANGQMSTVRIDVSPNTNYYFSYINESGGGLIDVSFANVYGGSGVYQRTINSSRLITTNSDTKQLVLSFYGSTGLRTFKNPMLNLGTTPKPFVPRNPSYLYAETTLAGNEDKKDILSYNDGRWEKVKWWEHVTLDGSLNWVYHGDNPGYKRVRIDNILNGTYLSSYGIGIKHDGKVMRRITLNSYWEPDSIQFGSANSSVYMTISDTDSGWGETMTPNPEQVKAYFNGWKYTGDGTTVDSWVSIVDGSAPPTNTKAYVSANMAPNFTPYKLTYQLANPIIEPVTVEGDLSIQGNAQVEVSSGVIVRERAIPTDDKSNIYSWLNYIYLPDSHLKNKAKRILAIYKNGKVDENWVIQVKQHTTSQ